MTTYIVRRRNKNKRIRGYTLVTEKNGTCYADAKIGGQYYGSLNYVLSGAIEFKTIKQLMAENDFTDETRYKIVERD